GRRRDRSHAADVRGQAAPLPGDGIAGGGGHHRPGRAAGPQGSGGVPRAGLQAPVVSRFLFVVPPMAGHVTPTLAVGRELAARGHEVAWAGPEEVVAELMPREATFLPVPLAPGVRDHIAARADDLRGAAALKHLVGEFLVPLASCMVPGVEAAVERFRPDVLVVDQQALAGVAVALARGLPWATSATTS